MWFLPSGSVLTIASNLVAVSSIAFAAVMLQATVRTPPPGSDRIKDLVAVLTVHQVVRSPVTPVEPAAKLPPASNSARRLLRRVSMR